jgi:hypothetical protein
MSGRALWHGSTVRRWRAYWRPRIEAAARRGEPLVCPFWLADPECLGPVLPVDSWDVDHRQQLVDGGELGLDNQAPAHTSCNRRAGARAAAARKTERITRIRRWH